MGSNTALRAQAAATAPAFEVASVKENVSASDNASVRAQPGGRVSLAWTPEQGPPGPDGTAPQASPSTDGVSLYTAVQEQLGLKLEAQRGPVDVLVIDSAQRPVED